LSTSKTPGTVRRDTRVFISAVSRELGTVRKLVKKALEDNDYHAVEQDNFELDYRDLRDKLHKKIESCDAVLHIAGHCYGAEPKQRPDDAPRRSYTQLEYDIAEELKKPVYVFLTGDKFRTDPHDPEPAELQELQQAHRQRLTSTGRDYSRAASTEELDRRVRSLQLKVERLGEELRQVDHQVAVTGRRLWRWLAGVAAVGVAILGTVAYVGWRQQVEQQAQQQEQARQEQERAKQERERAAAEAARKEAQTVVQIQKDFAERFLQQLLANKEITPEDARQRALKELPALVKLPLEEVESLIDRKIAPRATEASLSSLDRARAALAQGNYDEVFQAADREKEPGRELATLEGTAALARFRQSPGPEWNARALAAFQRAMALADPNSATQWQAWTDAAVSAASVLHDLARYSEAEPLLRDCLRLREANSGANSQGVSNVLDNLALLLADTNRLSEAEPLYRRALAIDEQSHGPDHPDVAIRLNNLADFLRNTNRLAEAEPMLRRAVAIDERSYGSDHPTVATVLDNLAKLLYATNRLSEAEPLYRRALAIAERSYGPDHPDVARDLNNLALLLSDTNRLLEAEPMLRRALAIAERSCGPDHPKVAMQLINLASLLQSNNRLLAEAESMLRRALEIDEGSYGPDHPDVAAALYNLAALLRNTNRLAEAEPMLRRALAIDERSYGPDHPRVASHLGHLAALLADTNRLSEAEPLYRRAVAIAERSYGPDHPDVAIFLNRLAALLRDTNRLAEAEPMLRRALAIAERSYGPDHPEVATDLNDLAGLLRSTDRLSEAEPLMRRALAIGERSYGPDHPTVATRLISLAELLRATSRLSEAEPLYRRAVAIDERSYGPDHPKVATDLGHLAGLLTATDRLSEAEPLSARAVSVLARFQRATGHKHPHQAIVAENYRELLSRLKLAGPEVAARMKAATEGTDRLSPIAPEVERLLGPARPVADVLTSLDHQYKEQGKPAVYSLGPGEPIAPHLDGLLRPNAEGLAAMGVAAYRRGDHADEIVLYEAALGLMANGPPQAPAKLTIRKNRAAALRELGLVEPARDELSGLLPDLEKLPAEEALLKGRTRYHLALCQWRLGDLAAARRSAEESLADYDGAPEKEPVDPGTRRQSEELLASLKAGKAPPPAAAVDAPAALEAARARYKAREALAALPLDQKAAPLLDQVLGPARPTQEVLEALDRQYRAQGKPPVWFLPLNEPIAPHLDELLGNPSEPGPPGAPNR
jgi:tetratricopeptide (TPR) repeat protein